jgi:hypothetical protein
MRDEIKHFEENSAKISTFKPPIRARRRRWLSAEGDMQPSIEKRRGEIKRFEEINAKFNTFKPSTRARRSTPARAWMPSR